MGSQGKSRGVSNSMQRVKVYRLNDDGKWDDRGTGHVSVDYMERSEDLGLYVIDEEDNNTLLAHRISSDEIYRRQEDTIISWRDPEFSTELALSFQEAVGCSYIWDHICSVQRNLQFSTLSNLEIGPRPATDNREASRTSQVNVATLVVHVAVLDNLYLADDVRPVILGMGSCKLSSDETLHSVNSELRELPPVELSTLPLIVKCEGVLGFGECSYRSSCSRELGDWMLTVVESCGADQMRVAELIIQDAFFHKLMDLFRICEDLENIDGLHIVYKLVKGIILLNNPQIFERIFGDEFIMDIIGTLEYDPDVPQVQQHRAFLKEHVVYKEAIPIKDPSVLSKIHQTYRIGYIKDVILPRVLDEATVANLNSITHANNAVVVSLLKDDSTFIQELFARMRSPGTSLESKKNLVLFLHEFCSLGKSLQLAQQLRLFRDLANEGIFDIITGMFQSHDKVLVLTGTDILILFLNQDPNLLRTYVIQQEGNSLLGLLIKGMISDFGEDMHCQFLEIIRILLDSYTLSGSQRDAIVEVFYEKHMEQLIDVLTSSCSPKGIARTSSQSAKLAGSGETQAVAKPEILSNICELLCFCVLHHPYRIKCNFLLNNVIEKILLLTHRKEKYLIVAAVRFLRTVISRNDDYLLRHIVKNNLLKPVIDAFIANGNRYNLLNSAVLELFEYIRKENLKHLIRYIVDCFWDQLEKFEYLDAIRSLKLKYEQSLENCQTRHSRSNMVDPRKRIDDRALEKEEEDYFNEDSDEEDSASARVSQKPNPPTQPVLVNGTSGSYPSLRSGSIGLVDYEDDDDDDCATPLGSKREISTAPDKIMDSPTLKRKLASRTDPNDEELELTKKQILDKNSNISAIAVAAGCSTCSPTQSNKEDLPNPHNAAAGNNVSEEAQNEKEPAVRRGCFNCMSNTEDVRQAIGEDHTSINNSASDIVTNGPKVTGSEAYSVR